MISCKPVATRRALLPFSQTQCHQQTPTRYNENNEGKSPNKASWWYKRATHQSQQFGARDPQIQQRLKARTYRLRQCSRIFRRHISIKSQSEETYDCNECRSSLYGSLRPEASFRVHKCLDDVLDELVVRQSTHDARFEPESSRYLNRN